MHIMHDLQVDMHDLQVDMHNLKVHYARLTRALCTTYTCIMQDILHTRAVSRLLVFELTQLKFSIIQLSRFNFRFCPESLSYYTVNVHQKINYIWISVLPKKRIKSIDRILAGLMNKSLGSNLRIKRWICQ